MSKPAPTHPWRSGSKPTIDSKIQAVDAGNQQAAEIILADAKSAGLMREWAEMVKK